MWDVIWARLVQLSHELGAGEFYLSILTISHIIIPWYLDSMYEITRSTIYPFHESLYGSPLPCHCWFQRKKSVCVAKSFFVDFAESKSKSHPRCRQWPWSRRRAFCVVRMQSGIPLWILELSLYSFCGSLGWQFNECNCSFRYYHYIICVYYFPFAYTINRTQSPTLVSWCW